MIEKKQELEEQIKTDYQEEMEYTYTNIIQAIKRARNQTGYLNLNQIAKAVMLGIGDDFPLFLKILVKELNKIATPKVAVLSTKLKQQ